MVVRLVLGDMTHMFTNCKQYGHVAILQNLNDPPPFSLQTERHFIMQVVCEATQCPDTRVSLLNMCFNTFQTLDELSSVKNSSVYGMCDPFCCVFQVRVAALQNLVKIMSLYYQYMETYMGPALFAVSTRP